jgi:hypothetical protein
MKTPCRAQKIFAVVWETTKNGRKWTAKKSNLLDTK